MNKTGLVLAAVLALIAAGAAVLLPRWAPPEAPAASPEAAIERWPEDARAAARAMLDKYGRPSQFDRETLAWFARGAWKRIVVYRRGCPSAGLGKKEHLEQAIGYLAPRSRVAELRNFSRRLEVG